MRWRSECLWIPLALLPILLGLWWIPGRTGGLSDTFSQEASGKKAIFHVAEELFPRVVRSTGSLPPADPEVRTLCLLGPVRYPHEGEWERLLDWVLEGNHLIFAARHRDPEVSLEAFEVEVVEYHESGGVSDVLDRSSLGRTITWRTHGSVRVESDSWYADEGEVLLSTDQGDQVLRIPYGSGQLTVVASDLVFSNHYLARGDHPELAAEILRAGAHPEGQLAFEESVNIRGEPQAFGILFGSELRPLTLQLLLCAVLLIWRQGRRFGAISPSPEGRRRELAEHARSLGNLHLRSGTGAHALDQYLDHFHAELRSHFAGGKVEPLIQSVWEQKGDREEGELALEAYRRARSRAERSRLSGVEAAESIRDLARIQLEIQGTRRV